MNQQFKHVVIFCIDSTEESYSLFLNKILPRWLSIKHLFIHVVTNSPAAFQSAEMLRIHTVTDFNDRHRLIGLSDILHDIPGDDIMLAAPTYLPIDSSIFVKHDRLAISAVPESNGYCTFDVFCFNKNKHKQLIDLLIAFSKHVYSHEDYYEYVNKQKINNDFIINLFLQTFLENSPSSFMFDELMKIEMSFVHETDTCYYEDGVLILLNRNFDIHVSFDDKYEMMIKNKKILKV